MKKTHALQDLYISLGYLPRIHYRIQKNSVIDGRVIKGGPYYDISITSTPANHLIKELGGHISKDFPPLGLRAKEKKIGNSFLVPVKEVKGGVS